MFQFARDQDMEKALGTGMLATQVTILESACAKTKNTRIVEPPY